MNRRSFLAGLSLAPIAATGAVAAPETPSEYSGRVLASADLPVAPVHPVDLEQFAADARGLQAWLQDEARRVERIVLNTINDPRTR